MIQHALVAGLVLTTLSVFPTVAPADQSDVATEAVLRVNVAGRQRMLSQRMVKAACLMAQDIDPTAAFDQLTQSYDLFVKSNNALRFGDPEIGLKEEEFGAVLAALAKVDPPWAIYSLVIERGIDNAEIPPTELTALDAAGLDVLRNMHSAVFVTAQAHAAAAPKVSLGLAVTVDVAGRQRMLTQKAVKEACLLRQASDPVSLSQSLSETIRLFDISLKALQSGHRTAGIVPPTSPEVARKLADVSELWRPVKAILMEAAKGTPMTDRDLADLARKAEPLLRTMNEAVGLYGV